MQLGNPFTLFARTTFVFSSTHLHRRPLNSVRFKPCGVKNYKMLHIGSTFPDIQAAASGLPDNKISLYNFLGDGWGLFMSHPMDFTPVCTTELAKAAELVQEFHKRNCKLVGFGCGDVESHKMWAKDIMSVAQLAGDLPFPVIADPDRKLALLLGLMNPEEKDAMLPLSCRPLVFIGPDKTVRAVILYPDFVGRNFHEILRVLDGLQLSDKYPVATPEGWKPGDKVAVQPQISDAEAKKLLPKGFQTKECPSGKTYLRCTPDPSA